MAKYQSATWIEPREARPRSLWPSRVLLGILAVAFIPLAFDGLKVSYANWVSMGGGYAAIKTPAFDFLQEMRRDVGRQSWQVLGPILRDPPWSAGTTIMLAAIWAIVMVWIFRGKHR